MEFVNPVVMQAIISYLKRIHADLNTQAYFLLFIKLKLSVAQMFAGYKTLRKGSIVKVN